MKGRKEGLVLVMNETCAYEELIDELKEKLSIGRQKYENGPITSVKVLVGNRYLSESQKQELTDVIRSFDHLDVGSIDSNVLTRAEFEEQKERERVNRVSRIIRSGQILSVKGDLLLIGDVNPGGTVSATGNVYILGALRGIACCGVSGSDDAIIVAAVMQPSQLRIGRRVSRTEEAPSEELRDDHILECAFVDRQLDKIIVDRLQTVMRQRQIMKNF
jgi:septum site-determining protein MinC